MCELGVFGHCSAHHRRKALFQWVLLPRTKGILWEALLSVRFPMHPQDTVGSQRTIPLSWQCLRSPISKSISCLMSRAPAFLPLLRYFFFFLGCDGVGNILFNAASSSLDVWEWFVHSCESSCVQRLSARRFSKQKQISSQESARVGQIQKLFLVRQQFPRAIDGQESLPSL